jgi:hypothetical protein
MGLLVLAYSRLGVSGCHRVSDIIDEIIVRRGHAAIKAREKGEEQKRELG